MSHWSLVLLLAAVFVTVAVASPTTELNESKSTAVGKRFTGWRVNCLTKWLECYLRIRVRVIIIIDFEGVVLSHQEFDFPYYIYAELNPDHILTSGLLRGEEQ
ncbi:uncharacterized protein LOC102809800 [Saccoglossus kowalevskii]|uniref:Uncharacterized protein LOC102809800 n=1 Tax=Saccoglossus kowalevskii TaxID=10224 RepID=A0ABM0M5H1_SACKO|nr:PREDICTED: uncharacterized protein LOC102809800 [Saccoglossus kowalevskii]